MSSEETQRKKIYSSIVKILLIAIGVGAAIFVALRVLDVAMFWSIYSTVFEKVRNVSGLDDNLTGIIAVITTAIAAITLPVLIGALLTGNKKKLLIVAGIAVCWFAGMFILSRPRDGEYFNRLTGSPQYKYSIREDGKIYLHSIGYNFDPKTGVKLDLFTAEVAKKHPEVFNPKPPEIVVQAPAPTPKPQIAERASDAEIVVKKRAVSVDGSRAAEIAREPEATPAPTATPTPRPKTLMEIAQNAPICEDAENITLLYEKTPRADIKLSRECWSGWVIFDFRDVYLYGHLVANIRNKGNDLILWFSDGRMFEGNIPNIFPNHAAHKIDGSYDRFRLLGTGTARAAIGRETQELEKNLNTIVRTSNSDN